MNSDPYVQIADRITPGATLLRRWPLHGGVSAHVEALELALPNGGRERVVLRQHGAAKWKALAADVTATEFNLLTKLAGAGMQVPKPVFLDATGALLGSPFFVMEFVDGAAEIDRTAVPDALSQMAEYLQRLHALRLEWPAALRSGEDPVAGALQFVPKAEPVYGALREIGALTPKNPPVLVHGDYWPGNVLWKDSKIAAVLDWEDSGLGDPLSDLACCRLELLWRYGPSEPETFTNQYLARATIDCADLPFWELYAASAAAASMGDWGLDPARVADMRRKAETVIASASRAILDRSE